MNPINGDVIWTFGLSPWFLPVSSLEFASLGCLGAFADDVPPTASTFFDGVRWLVWLLALQALSSTRGQRG